jgi:hypothetical protein
MLANRHIALCIVSVVRRWGEKRFIGQTLHKRHTATPVTAPVRRNFKFKLKTRILITDKCNTTLTGRLRVTRREWRDKGASLRVDPVRCIAAVQVAFLLACPVMSDKIKVVKAKAALGQPKSGKQEPRSVREASS